MKFDIVRITAKTGSAGVASYSHNLGETPKLALFLLPAGQYDDSTEGSFLSGIGHMTFGATDGVRSRCGFGGVTVAGSNHTARRAIEAVIPLHAVAELLGHSSTRMTERYSHPQESVKKATEVLATF